jgi:CheY-like chemotaxis protein
MAKPVILSIDDEPQVLHAINRDLRQHYGRNYRILKAGSGQEGLDILTELKKRNDTVALFLVDQRMPEMEGTEFLIEAMKFYPDARKVLLTAYADTEAASIRLNWTTICSNLGIRQRTTFTLCWMISWMTGWQPIHHLMMASELRVLCGRRPAIMSKISSLGTEFPTSGWILNWMLKPS